MTAYRPGPRDPMGALALLVEAYTIGDTDDQRHAMDVAQAVLQYDRLAVKSQATRMAGECGRCDRAVQTAEGGTWVDAMGDDQCAGGGPHQVIRAPEGYHLCPGCDRMHAYPTDTTRVAPDDVVAITVHSTPPQEAEWSVALTACDVCQSVYLGSAWCHDQRTTDHLVVVRRYV